MEELRSVRILVEQGLERLAAASANHPLRRLRPVRLRRLLAEAAFRELRTLHAQVRGGADDR